MAGTSLLALLDDIASVLDDVSVMTKLAAKKTAGVLGDDLALNAQQVTGVKADRELPVVWAVAKGSLRNKLILVPAALLISAVAPWLITPLLMLGGAFLCFEGFEKLAHKFLHSAAETEQAHAAEMAALQDENVDLLAFEQDKIKGPIRTDFVLSAEIIAITLGVVATSSLSQQLAVLSGIALLMTVGVYGFVAGIVKLDDAGLYLLQQSSSFSQRIGRGILAFAPWLMKTLSVVGTAAMFLVGGGIPSHGWSWAHHMIQAASQNLASLGSAGPVLAAVTPSLLDGVLGIVAGAVCLLLVSVASKLWQHVRPSA